MDGSGWVWVGWDGNLCVGLLYEHRFAVLKSIAKDFFVEKEMKKSHCWHLLKLPPDDDKQGSCFGPIDTVA